MSDDIVVVDNGSTYETQESAIVAKNEADRAEQWAKYSEEKANLADERAVDAAESSDAAAQAATAAIEAKQYAETAITDENLIVVATDLKSTPSNIKKTAGSIDNVNTVSNDIENINAVAANKTNIDKVAASKDNIDTVATNIVNVNTVAKNIDNVNLLAPHTEAMEALAPDIMDVVTVAGIAKQTKNVSENMAHVVAVDNNKANIDKAVANATNITTVATNINNVNAVAGNKANIDNVAANKTNINTVSTNITAVNNVSENMADVKNAVQSANDAKLWAVGTIAEKPEGSSKYWAEQAQQAAQVYDASETVKGIVRLATSEEAKAGLDDKTAITPLKLKQNIVDNVGRVNQLGFNGVLQSGVITFTPDQGTYELKAGYEYEIDLLFSAVGIISDETQLKIVNGTDTINIVNVLDSDYSKPTTYKAMKQVCRYDTEIGWRWIFNVRYSVASDGSKVFVMPATSINVSESSNNIGEITSFVCSSTYIPRGCLPCDGGEYSKEQFKDLWNNYLADGKLLTCTYTQYASDISTYGQCAKFAIDTTNNKFKVPTIKDGSYITQALSDAELGKSYKESLPNIKGEFRGSETVGFRDASYMTGAFNLSESSELPNYLAPNNSYRGYPLNFDASRSSSTYQDGAKVQGDNIRLRFFVVVANGEINQSVMDWSAWATSLESKQDKSTAVNYNNITNCITEIPQDIKLELNNGTLTLKAGSKVYIPNGFEMSVEPLYAWPVNDNEIYYTESETPAVGDKTFNEKGIYTYYKVHDISGTTLTLQKGKDTDSVIMQTTVTRDTSKDTYFSKPDTSKPKFDVITIESDKIVDCGSVTEKTFIRVYQNQLPYGEIPVSIFYSGSDPSGIKGIFYNTTTNEIKYHIDGAATGNICSFPVAEITVNNGKVTSIDQVFNGFGYIGSTIYALPGVKGLIPNGRNADGSLKNIEFTTSNVAIFNRTYPNDSGKNYYFLYPDNTITDNGNLIIQDHEPSSWNYEVWFDIANNLIKYNDGTTIFKVEAVVFGASFYSSGKITSFTPKTVFHALDYNDKSTISGWSMPSSRYIDLTLGASGSTYTAPANGYLYLKKNYTAKNQYIWFKYYYANSIMDITFWGSETGFIGASVPVREGSKMEIWYGAAGDTIEFRFIYAEGEHNNLVSSGGGISGGISGGSEEGDQLTPGMN